MIMKNSAIILVLEYTSAISKKKTSRAKEFLLVSKTY